MFILARSTWEGRRGWEREGQAVSGAGEQYQDHVNSIRSRRAVSGADQQYRDQDNGIRGRKRLGFGVWGKERMFRSLSSQQPIKAWPGRLCCPLHVARQREEQGLKVAVAPQARGRQAACPSQRAKRGRGRAVTCLPCLDVHVIQLAARGPPERQAKTRGAFEEGGCLLRLQTRKAQEGNERRRQTRGLKYQKSPTVRSRRQAVSSVSKHRGRETQKPEEREAERGEALAPEEPPLQESRYRVPRIRHSEPCSTALYSSVPCVAKDGWATNNLTALGCPVPFLVPRMDSNEPCSTVLYSSVPCVGTR